MMGYVRNLIYFLAIFLLSSVSVDAAEDYYVWVDENGVTNYAQRNPTGYDADHVTKARRFGDRFVEERRSATPPNSTPVSSGEVDPDAIIAEEREALAVEIASLKKSNCDIGKKNLARLEAFRRIRVTDDLGENRVISDEEKAEKVAVARQVIRENCRA